MTRNWFAKASQTLPIGRSSRRSQAARFRLEHLENRLALSSYAASAPDVFGLKHGPAAEVAPQIKLSPLTTPDLNPQPLPPGFMMKPEIVGRHIG